MKTKFLALVGAVGVILSGSIASAEEMMKPFVLASMAKGDAAAVVATVKGKLTQGGFQIVGEHSPYPSTTLLIVTNDGLKAAAAKSDFGGYAAGQRVSISDVNGQIQVSYTNPKYMASAYRMKVDLAATAKQLASALGKGEEYGPSSGMSDEDLRDYHYMFGMEYFDEPSVLNKFASYEAAVAAVEKGLAAKTSGTSKVYRIDIPGKKETVFGVSLVGDGIEDGKMQDDGYIMGKIDFKGIKSAAHLPYEILVSGDTAYALYARFRIAINFPDLSMMGGNSFMSIMESPETIRKALTAVSGGTFD